MAISGIILMSVGSAIAKHIVKSWLDNDLLDQLADELIDLIRDKGHQTVEGRRQQKDSDKLAAAITSNMQQVYDKSNLPSNSKQAVAIEVALTLNKSNLSVQTAIAHNMDDDKLARLLTNNRPDAMKLFSVDEAALYERLIFEAAHAQVQMAGLLESFTGAFAAKVLKDNERLLSIVEKLVREPDEQSKQFLIHYKDTVKRKLDRLEVFGLPKLDRYSRQLSLSIAYISLDVEPRILDSPTVNKIFSYIETTIPKYKMDEEVLSLFSWENLEKTSLAFKLVNEAKKSGISGAPVLNDKSGKIEITVPFIFGFPSIASRPNSIEAILANKRRIVVQGQAGSGKTTLLQWLAVRAASSDFEHPLSSWNQEIPFFIRLREYVNRGFPTPQEFLEKVAPMIVESMPPNWVHDVLDSGHGLVLVDGVDELPLDQRDAMLARLSDLVETYPASRYLISSRPAALKEQLWPQWKEWVESEGFVTTTLRDMDSILLNFDKLMSANGLMA